MPATRWPIRQCARLAGAALLALLALPGREATAQRPAQQPEERFTPAPAPSVALPRLTPSGGARADGLAPAGVFQPPPVVAPPLSPVRVPGAPPPLKGAAPRPAVAKTAPAPAAAPPPTAPPPPTTPGTTLEQWSAPAVPTAEPPPPAGPAPAKTAPPPPAPPALGPGRTVVTTAAVKLRAAPKASARALDELERGERLEVIAPAAAPAADGWTQVGRNGKPLGYVASAYLADAKQTDTKRTDATRTDAGRLALGRYAKASREDHGCALPDDVPAGRRRAALPAGTVARVLADANLRVAPACDAKVADVLEDGERVTVLDSVGSWYRVGRGGRALGYVGAALLAPAKGR